MVPKKLMKGREQETKWINNRRSHENDLCFKFVLLTSFGVKFENNRAIVNEASLPNGVCQLQGLKILREYQKIE